MTSLSFVSWVVAKSTTRHERTFTPPARVSGN
jgi:hypothetical protein